MNDSVSLPKELLMIDAANEGVDYQNTAENSDMRLVARVLAGDETAFEIIFERYKKPVAIVASRYFRRSEQIEEIIQATFAKAFFELPNFRGAHDFSLPAWLGRIATNQCLDTLKKSSFKSEDLTDDFAENEKSFLHLSAFDAENNLIDRDLAEKLLERLPNQDRALLQMLYAEEMSVKEISRVTGWSAANIKVRAFRARRALRKFLRKLL